MPRIARIVAPGYPYHVTQRGNYQQPIFEEEDDFRQYLQEEALGSEALGSDLEYRICKNKQVDMKVLF